MMRIGFVAVVIVTLLSVVSRAAPAPGATPATAPPQRPAPAAPLAPATPSAGDALPTIEQLNAQLAEGKHQDVLKQVAKLLQLKGDAAKSYDRYDLLCLRGEAALRGKANSMAMEAFAQAARATEDKDKQGVAKATELLIRRSKPLGYVPRAAAAAAPTSRGVAPKNAGAEPVAVAKSTGGGNQPIPIIESADRKRAFAAMLADEMAVVNPKVQAATKSESLPPVIEAVKSLGDLRGIEVAATGGSEQSKGISADLGTHAHRMISRTLDTMSKRVEECFASGKRVMVTEYTDGSRYRQPGMVGLTSAEQNDLKGILNTAEKIQPVAAELANVTEAKELIADAQDAQRLRDRTAEVLTFDYPNSGRYNKDPKKPAR
jgi:hypothetical protein